MVIHAAISAVLRIVSCTVSVFICVDGHCSWDFAFLISASIQPGSAAMQSLASWCTSVKNFFLSSGAWDGVASAVFPDFFGEGYIRYFFVSVGD